MKNLGFLSFGHWSKGAGSRIRTAADAVLATDRSCRRRGGGGHGTAPGSASTTRTEPLLSVPPARRNGGAHTTHRARNGRHQHALREPALHGGTRRNRGPHQRRQASARRERWTPRLLPTAPAPLATRSPLEAARRRRGRAHRALPRGHRGRGSRRAEPEPLRPRAAARRRETPDLARSARGCPSASGTARATSRAPSASASWA